MGRSKKFGVVEQQEMAASARLVATTKATAQDFLEVQNHLNEMMLCMDGMKATSSWPTTDVAVEEMTTDSSSAPSTRFAQLFTENGEIEIVKMQATKRGTDEIRGFCAFLQEKFAGSQHWEGNIVLKDCCALSPKGCASSSTSPGASKEEEHADAVGNDII